MFKIRSVSAREILDSRGVPTVEVEVRTSVALGRASAPSGASTGRHEAVELRDGGKRFFGRGVRKAVENVNTKIAKALAGIDVRRQREIDLAMVRADRTKNKSSLGANAMVAASLACARCAAHSMVTPLYQYIEPHAHVLPVPMMNVINGGVHAGNALSIQEFMLVPLRARSFAEAVRMGSEIYHELGVKLVKKYGAAARNVGDEGGYAPPMKRTEEALDALSKAVEECGYGHLVQIALDSAATQFYKPAKKMYSIDGKMLTRDSLIDYYKQLADSYNLISIEDPLHEEDFAGFAVALKALRGVMIVGDDLLVTNMDRIARAVEMKSASALLMKFNQIGTVSEALDAVLLAKANGMKVVVSHRSGETEDTSIADMAVGIGAEFIKAGAPCRGERTSKYNQLLRIEEDLEEKARYAGAGSGA